MPSLDDAAAQNASTTGQTPNYLHVLAVSSAAKANVSAADSSGQASHMTELIAQLRAADGFLAGQTSYAQQRAYNSCGRVTRAEVREYLAAWGDKVRARASDSLRLAYEQRVNILDSADVVFRLFFPRAFDGPTTGQYWASIKMLVIMPPLGDDDGDETTATPADADVLHHLQTHLRGTAQDIQAFQSIVAHAGSEDRAGLDVPRPFARAWLHVVSGMLKAAAMPASGSWFAHMARAQALIEEGMQSVLHTLSRRSLVKDLAVLPMDVACLVMMSLLKDQVGRGDDVGETYSQYLSALDTDITNKPSDRSYQHRVELVQQEMSAIQRTLVRQRSIISGLRRGLAGGSRAGDGVGHFVEMKTTATRRRSRTEATPLMWEDQPPAYGDVAPAPRYTSTQTQQQQQQPLPPYMGFDTGPPELEAASKLAPTDAFGLRGLFLAECARLVDQREFDFRRHVEFAADLERAAVYKMGWTKDRQENAIYAFTVVTIVFLPISAISSIFGMNTNDVRNMAANQWLYWAVAVPVTLLVIVVGLWWMSELGTVLRWMTGGLGFRGGGRGSLRGREASRSVVGASRGTRVVRRMAAAAYRDRDGERDASRERERDRDRRMRMRRRRGRGMSVSRSRSGSRSRSRMRSRSRSRSSYSVGSFDRRERGERVRRRFTDG